MLGTSTVWALSRNVSAFAVSASSFGCVVKPTLEALSLQPAKTEAPMAKAAKAAQNDCFIILIYIIDN